MNHVGRMLKEEKAEKLFFNEECIEYLIVGRENDICMKLFLVYAATGDFYELYELRAVFTDQNKADRLADKIHNELKDESDLDGYDGLLVFIRESVLETDTPLSSSYSNWDDIPSEWFIGEKGRSEQHEIKS